MAVVFDDEELVEALLNRRSGRRLAREELDLDFPSLRRALADKGFVIGIYSPLRYGAAGIVVPEDADDLHELTADRGQYVIPYAVQTSLLVSSMSRPIQVRA